ncbi:MAG: sialate O-acetylesterase [Rubripirellula sp.]
MNTTTRVVLLLAIACPFSASLQATDFLVFYLGGQSNMDGFGYSKDLPANLKVESEIPIFHGNPVGDGDLSGGLGRWSMLRPGHGIGFSSDGIQDQLSNRFGVEVSLGHRLQQLFPEQKVALIKYSRSGSSIAEEAAGQFGCWEPDYQKGSGESAGINQYDHFLKTIRSALAGRDIDGDGTSDRLIPAGIVWMQGESDAAAGSEIAGRYEANLKRLMDLVRAALRADDLAVVIGRISDSGQDDQDGRVWDHGDEVRSAQAAFVQNDANAALVTSTDKYEYSDKWHYDSAGYVDLGKQFADALRSLQIP